ncbi:uridine kinase family protein [Actinoplanes friuliensis]|uniref:uridine kinase family protein n=1 Tax=Actinoplanes friuliensis TaxID=196914 RepID=UPI0003F787DB|nr:hypothetical protein [Actinoplanes friuliensis]
MEPWRVATTDEVLTRVRQAVGEPADRPPVLAVDGRSAGGKTTFARRLAAAWPGATVIHTDDIAWNQAVLDWTTLLVDGVLTPLREGRAVSYRPPQWDARGREGAIEVSHDCTLVIVEGVGSGRRELEPHLDAVVWVETSQEETERRDAVRIAAGETTEELYALWMAEENPFVDDQKTWERAAFLVSGVPALPHNPETEFLIST